MKSVIRTLVLTLLAVIVTGCHTPSNDSSQASAYQLKSYAVPVSQSKAIAQNLDAILASPGFQVGTKTHSEMRATQPFPGVVLVLAPASVQPSIASAIADLNKASNEQAKSAPESVSLRVHFWLVQAKAGNGADSTVLKPLDATLARIRSSLGSSHFVLADGAALSVEAPSHRDPTAGNGMLITSRGNKFVFRAVAPNTKDVSLNVQLFTRGGSDSTLPELNTTVAMRPGEYVVLAQAPSTEAAARAKDTTLMNLLVARVDTTAPVAH